MAHKKQKKVRSRFYALKGEDELVDAMFYALTTMAREHALAWVRRSEKIAEGLSPAAIKRAEKRAHDMADDMPPGHVRAMEATDIFDGICREHGIPKRDQDTLWGSVAQFCMFQLASRTGRFYEAARDFKIVEPAPRPVQISVAVDRGSPSARDSNAVCDCPNCRPRKAEELN